MARTPEKSNSYMTATARKPWVAMYTVAGLIWGASFLFIEYALTALSPIGVAFWRTTFGALAMLIAILIYRSKLPTSFDVWRKMTIAGLFMSSVPFTLIAYAQTYVSSALASILNAVFRSEKVKAHVVVGLFVGLAGVLVILGVWQGFGDNEPLAIVAILVAIFCYGIGTPYVRKNITPLGYATEVSVFGQIGTASLTLLPVYLLSGPLITSSPTVMAITSIVILGALGSGVAYLLFYKVLDVVGSAIAASVTYITPIIAVVLGVVLLNEQLHWYEPVGGIIVILGAAISQGSILSLFKGKQNA
jgi:drug/metabolite transporter (DMT)-like permease